MKKNGIPSRRSNLLLFFLLKPLMFLFTRVFLGYRCRDRYRIKKGESVILLSNHQTDYDPFCILPCFSRPLYPVATDNIFSGALGRFLARIGVIPKKKGAADTQTTLRILRTLRNGASVMLFPEGNRYYAEFRYYIAPTLARFIKTTKATVVLFNLHGGSGVSPRFKHRNRRGKFYGEIKRVLRYDEYSLLEDGELYRIITDGISVFDSDSGERYRSGARAEYLERMLFVCPKCKKTETLASSGDRVFCLNCGLSVIYREDLHFESDDPEFGFSRLIDWWSFQKKYMRELAAEPGETVFGDGAVRLFRTERFKKKVLLAEGELTADCSSLCIGGKRFGFDGITAVSVVSGRNLTFSCGDADYMIRGGERFNPLKYVFLINRHNAGSRGWEDRYFNLED
ncbi:MAG: 1-acyl-sn-glycerol-3-phosphate acyltransferase [Clostridia bacterium]|nr:1-acyl-sn-glycerol-3-phosphate acyltransferase [Clostridia bacterium]